jgi:hypothetical protein
MLHRIVYSCLISLQLPYKFADRLDPSGFRLLYPALQTGHLAVAQNAAKAQHQVTHRGEIRRPLQTFHDLVLPLTQHRFRFAQQRRLSFAKTASAGRSLGCNAFITVMKTAQLGGLR